MARRTRIPVAATSLALLLALLAPARGAPARGPDEGDDQYQYIVGLLEKGMTDRAVREATEFLRERPDHPRASLARYRLATALYELERFEDAAGHLRALADLRGFDYEAEVCFRLGQCELALDRTGPAERALSRVLELDADYLRVPAGYLLADAALRDGRHADAERRFAGVLSADPGGEYAADARAGSAWCALRTERWDDAASRAGDYLRRHADGPRADEMRVVLGEARAGAGRPREALAAYAEVRDGAWRDAALRGVGFARSELGEHAAAAEAFADLRRRDPDGRFASEARLQEGIARLRAGDPAAALRVLEEAPADDPETLLWRARAHEAGGDPAAALRTLDRALGAAPGEDLAGRLQAARGDVLTALGRGEEAVEAYGRAGSEYAVHAAAVASLNEGRPAEAVRLATRFLEEHPDSPYAPATRLALGEALLQEGRHDVAADAFRAAARGAEDPAAEARALTRVGWCEYLGGDPGAAAATFARAAASAGPAADEALFMQGRASLDAGDATGAAQAWRAHRRRFPDGARAPEVLLELADLAGDGAEASELLRDLLARFPDDPLAARAAFELGERLEAAGDGAGAEAARRALLERHPDHELVAPAAYALAFQRYEAGAPDEAAAALDTALAAQPEPELRVACQELRVWCERARGDTEATLRAFAALARQEASDDRLWAAGRAAVDALREDGRSELADGLLTQLAERVQDPAVRAEVESERVFTALDRGAVDEAERLVRARLREGAPTAATAEAAFFVAEARYEAGEFEVAAELYRVAFDAEGTGLRDRALYKGGFAALEAGDAEAAQGRFERLVREHGDSELAGEALFLAGECAYRRGRYEEAAVALRRLLEEQPRHATVPKARFRLGLALAQVERWDDAERTLADLARRHPDFELLTESELWRGRALAAQGRARPAEQALRRVIAEDQGALSARARNALGELRLAAGDREAALAEFLKVAVLYDLPDEVGQALLLAGECLEGLGDRERARLQYEELIERYPRSPLADEARRRSGSLGTF